MSDLDVLEDLDRDRIPNFFEFANGTLPNNAASIPATHITVDPATVTDTASQKRTIMAAISEVSNLGRHTIIRVKQGIYPESVNIDTHRILLLGDLGPNPPVIQPTSSSALHFRERNSVIDGFHLRPGPSNTSPAISVQSDLATDQVRIINSKITHFASYYSSAGYISTGRLTLAHCTVMDNISQSTCHAFQVYSSGRLSLQNSIVWNPGSVSLPQIYQDTPGIATATGSIILGGELGATSSEPGTDRYHGLMPGSPALGAGAALSVAGLDIHGEPRPAQAPDIGADQRRDSDADGLPDWWELSYFGNLTRTGNGDNDAPQLDRLTNYYEYLLGFNPLLPLSPGSTQSDLYTAVFERQPDPWYPQEWWLDPDNDGLTDNYELYYQTSPSTQDTNGDGISDYVAILTGFSPTSNDADGDGIPNDVEIANGTNPLFADTDSDGVNDGQDDFPLDPAHWQLPVGSAGDIMPPVINLVEPVGAVLVP
jgi:hypothetical protein